MDARMEILASIALEDGGISLPLRLLWRKKHLRVTMRIPTLESLLRISRMYVEIGVTGSELDQFTFEQNAEFIAMHGKQISKMVTYGIVRGYLLGRLLNRPVAWFLRNYMHPSVLGEAWKIVLSSINTAPFGPIIKSAEVINKLAPVLSQKEKRS